MIVFLILVWNPKSSTKSFLKSWSRQKKGGRWTVKFHFHPLIPKVKRWAEKLLVLVWIFVFTHHRSSERDEYDIPIGSARRTIAFKFASLPDFKRATGSIPNRHWIVEGTKHTTHHHHHHFEEGLIQRQEFYFPWSINTQIFSLQKTKATIRIPQNDQALNHRYNGSSWEKERIQQSRSSLLQ